MLETMIPFIDALKMEALASIERQDPHLILSVNGKTIQFEPLYLTFASPQDIELMLRKHTAFTKDDFNALYESIKNTRSEARELIQQIMKDRPRPELHKLLKDIQKGNLNLNDLKKMAAKLDLENESPSDPEFMHPKVDNVEEPG